MSPNKLLKNKNSIQVELDVFLVKEDIYWVAFCPALDITGSGMSQAAAKKDFEKVMDIFIEETVKDGNLEKYLLKNGWRLQQDVYKQPIKTELKLRVRERGLGAMRKLKYSESVYFPVVA